MANFFLTLIAIAFVVLVAAASLLRSICEWWPKEPLSMALILTAAAGPARWAVFEGDARGRVVN
jgi:hypothetical protein